MECQHPSMIHVLNNAAWSDSHGAAHEPRKDRNTMNEEEDAYPAKQNCSPASVNSVLAGIKAILQLLRVYGHKLALGYLNTIVLEMTHS